MKRTRPVTPKPAAPRKLASKHSVPNLERGMLILELLGKHPGGLGLIEIARALRIPNNSVFRIANTFTAMGYLHRCKTSLRFVLTRKLLGIGYGAVSQQNIVAVSMELLKQLRDEVKETVALATLLPEEARVLVLAQVKSTYSFGYHIEEGTRVELHCSAPGKAVLASLPESELQAVVKRITFTRYNEHTLTTREELLAELDRVRQEGYSLDREEVVNGCHCAAAPVLDGNGYPIAAIWTTGPSNRLTAKDLPLVGGVVQAYATKISERLSFPL